MRNMAVTVLLDRFQANMSKLAKFSASCMLAKRGLMDCSSLCVASYGQGDDDAVGAVGGSSFENKPRIMLMGLRRYGQHFLIRSRSWRKANLPNTGQSPLSKSWNEYKC